MATFNRISLKQNALKIRDFHEIATTTLGAGGRAFKSPRPDQWNQSDRTEARRFRSGDADEMEDETRQAAQKLNVDKRKPGHKLVLGRATGLCLSKTSRRKNWPRTREDGRNAMQGRHAGTSSEGMRVISWSFSSTRERYGAGQFLCGQSLSARVSGRMPLVAVMEAADLLNRHDSSEFGRLHCP
jgi:hypothetical protein